LGDDAGVLFLLPLALAAEDAPTTGPTLGLGGGAYLTPESNPLRSGPEIVLRVGVRAASTFDIEAEAGRVDSETRDLRINYHLWNPRLNLLFHATPNQRADLFLGVGAGLQHVSVSRSSEAEGPGALDRALYRNPSLDYVMNAGPGLTLHLVGPLHLRTDLRWYGSFGADATLASPDRFQNLEWTLAMDLRAEAKPVRITDTDGDGLVDEVDACPTDPEDFDAFEDGDGCPELDNDRDGLPDARDTCRNDPEDRDGWLDEDGCPDPDNDGDGLLDRVDACPDVREDYDEFQDTDGCPDDDNDGDGLPDRIDHCVNDPETVNEYQDGDGCPDSIPERIKKFTGVIRGITFETNKAIIRPTSEPVLYEALGVLTEYPDLRLEIQGHTDDVGDDRFNLELSERRAAAVVDWFIIHGVDATRLRSVGYGELKPVAENLSDAGRAENRRVEFRRLGLGE